MKLTPTCWGRKPSDSTSISAALPCSSCDPDDTCHLILRTTLTADKTSPSYRPRSRRTHAEKVDSESEVDGPALRLSWFCCFHLVQMLPTPSPLLWVREPTWHLRMGWSWPASWHRIPPCGTPPHNFLHIHRHVFVGETSFSFPSSLPLGGA